MNNDNEIKKEFQAEYQRQKSLMQKPNLMIVGGTGVGKSSLINKVFGADIAQVGSGEPVTRGVERFAHADVPLIVYDTEGYEISADGINYNFIDVVIQNIVERKRGELNEQVHLIWYAISIGNHRVTDFDLQMLNELHKRFPSTLAVVLTQCDEDNEDDNGNGVIAEELKRVIKTELNDLPVFETTTHADFNFQLPELLNWSINALDDVELQRAFIAAQVLDQGVKVETAKALITTYQDEPEFHETRKMYNDYKNNNRVAKENSWIDVLGTIAGAVLVAGAIGVVADLVSDDDFMSDIFDDIK